MGTPRIFGYTSTQGQHTKLPESEPAFTGCQGAKSGISEVPNVLQIIPSRYKYTSDLVMGLVLDQASI